MGNSGLKCKCIFFVCIVIAAVLILGVIFNIPSLDIPATSPFLKIQKGYFFQVILGALFTRLVLSFFKACELQDEIAQKSYKQLRVWRETLCCDVWRCFLSTIQNRNLRDHWLPFFVGCCDLLAYPVLFKIGLWKAIGAWLTLKTVGAWSNWKDNRYAYMRFLLGNALILIYSIGYLTQFVAYIAK